MDEKTEFTKVLAQNEKLKSKYLFEKEVSKELATRNDMLKRENGEEHEKYRALVTYHEEIKKMLDGLMGLVKEVSPEFNSLEDTDDKLLQFVNMLEKQQSSMTNPLLLPPSDGTEEGEESNQPTTSQISRRGSGRKSFTSMDRPMSLPNPHSHSPMTLSTNAPLSNAHTPNSTVVPSGTSMNGGSSRTRNAHRRRTSSVCLPEGLGTSLTRKIHTPMSTPPVTITNTTIDSATSTTSYTTAAIVDSSSRENSVDLDTSQLNSNTTPPLKQGGSGFYRRISLSLGSLTGSANKGANQVQANGSLTPTDASASTSSVDGTEPEGAVKRTSVANLFGTFESFPEEAEEDQDSNEEGDMRTSEVSTSSEATPAMDQAVDATHCWTDTAVTTGDDVESTRGAEAPDTFPAELSADPEADEAEPPAPLFEHFLVVGVPIMAGDEFAQNIMKTVADSYTNRLRKRFGNMFVSTPSMANIPSNDTVESYKTTSTASVLTASKDRANTQLQTPSGATTTSRFLSYFSSPVSSPVSGASAAANAGSAPAGGDALPIPPLQGYSSRFDGTSEAGNTTSGESDDASPAEVSSTEEPVASHGVGNANATGLSTPPREPSPPASIPSHAPLLPSDAPSLLTTQDISQGHAHTNATVLYRYPPEVDPPPAEICDFCMPLGAKMKRILGKNSEDTVIQEILYGHGQSKRSSKCFIFMLEDRTISTDTIDEENGIGTGRMFGICVVHPRLLHGSSTVPITAISQSTSGTAAGNSNGVSLNTLHGTKSDGMATVDFEAGVCFAFVTRYPMFEFFFQLIWDIITTERLQRMEAMVLSEENDLDRRIYQYLPSQLLTETLGRLSKLTAPKYNESIVFSVSKSLNAINWRRAAPIIDMAEHALYASEWALPTLLSWIPVELLVWTLGLIMCECKVLVVGTEPGLVSCGVMGLLSLLRPLEWVAPIIPLLPHKHLDFIESPVPIVAGLVLEAGLQSTTTMVNGAMTPLSLLDRCDDESNTTVVFDVSKRAAYVSSSHSDELREYILPGAEALVDKLEECTRSGFGSQQKAANLRGQSVMGTLRSRPLYELSVAQRSISRDVQTMVMGHMMTVVTMTTEHGKATARARQARLAEGQQRAAAELELAADNDMHELVCDDEEVDPERQSMASNPTDRVSFSTTGDGTENVVVKESGSRRQSIDISQHPNDKSDAETDRSSLVSSDRISFSSDRINSVDRNSLTDRNSISTTERTSVGGGMPGDRNSLSDSFRQQLSKGLSMNVMGSSQAPVMRAGYGSSTDLRGSNANTVSEVPPKMIYLGGSSDNIHIEGAVSSCPLHHGDVTAFYRRFASTQIYTEYTGIYAQTDMEDL